MSTAARGGNRDYCYREVVPFAAMVSLQCINVGLNTLFKVAANGGMSRHVFIAYAYAVAALILLPAPFFSRRSGTLPSLNLSILVKFFVLGVIGYSSQLMGFTGINYGSPTLASAISNLSPAFTFVLAVIFRMEKLMLSSSRTWAKLVGAIVSISGAFVVTFYKGPIIINAPFTTPLTQYPVFNSTRSDWILGSLFLTVEYILSPIWCIFLTHIMKEYPSGLTIMFFYTSSVSVLAAAVGIFAEPDSSKWIIRPNIALVTIVASGVLNGCISNSVDSWLLHMRGPVYVAMFKPLQIAIAAAMGVIILGDTLYLGSMIGAMIIVTGFYTVMWGKAKEEGVLNGCISNSVDSWLLHMRGPVYVAMFKPLQIAIAAAMGVIILGDTLYLGSMIGAIIIVTGFYTVMWGKSKEDVGEFVTETGDLEWSATDQTHSLLQSYKVQDL